ncbi:hypothetical protein BJV78DRAFT_1177940 [Lactifluus subvellereus]|nr:hypothetical protein BJV78DRAFT_1177940 [Lactifluus subvellereus]
MGITGIGIPSITDRYVPRYKPQVAHMSPRAPTIIPLCSFLLTWHSVTRPCTTPSPRLCLCRRPTRALLCQCLVSTARQATVSHKWHVRHMSQVTKL